MTLSGATVKIERDSAHPRDVLAPATGTVGAIDSNKYTSALFVQPPQSLAAVIEVPMHEARKPFAFPRLIVVESLKGPKPCVWTEEIQKSLGLFEIDVLVVRGCA